MKLLFEEYSYPTQLLQDIAGSEVELYHIKGGNGSKLTYVGYFFNPQINDSVFILPKVFISENSLAFDRYKPEEIVDITPGNNPLKENNDDAVVFELSAWLYQAISHYCNRKEQSVIASDIQVQNVRPRGDKGSKTIIEIMLSLLAFNKKHRNLFTYISLVNSSGNDKVHWAKTISKVQPIIKNDTPYYLEFRNRNKVINLDEELITLFYSVLNYLSACYHCKYQSVQGFSIIRPSKIESMIVSGKGTRLLKKIRRNYYSDELVELWHLLLEFFERSELSASGKAFHEKLLVSNFNIVFEDMIDQLISDDRNAVPKELWEQPDGKIVDHIYKDQSLIEENRQIYFIGDSKYYKETTGLGPNSIFKQFTYAKNVIQYNINLFNIDGDDSVLRYRDSLTEGYNITPNFFIRGVIDFDNPRSQEMKIKKHDGKDHEEPELLNRHFHNRLFDRDTLFLQTYSINFMFVISSYVKNSDDTGIKKGLQRLFRKNFIDYIKGKFDFYTLKPRIIRLENAVEKDFKLLVGKIYKPTDSGDVLILALDSDEKYQTENLALLNRISSDFIIGDYELGTDPAESKPIERFRNLHVFSMVAEDSAPDNETDDQDGVPKIYKQKKESVLLGVCKDAKHKEWILKNNAYNVRLGARVGAVKKIKQVLDAAYLVLYDYDDASKYKVFKLSDKHHEWNASKMKETGYEIGPDAESNKYFIYQLLEEIQDLGDIDVQSLLRRKKAEILRDTGSEPADGAPIYIYLSELELQWQIK